MMNARGLPVELLDEDELKQRFKKIDAAIERVKHDIENAGTEPKIVRVRVKLHDTHQGVTP